MKIDFINEGRIFVDVRDLTSAFNLLLDNKNLNLDNDTLRYVTSFIESLEISADAAAELGNNYIEVKNKDYLKLKNELQKLKEEALEESKKEELKAAKESVTSSPEASTKEEIETQTTVPEASIKEVKEEPKVENKKTRKKKINNEDTSA